MKMVTIRQSVTLRATPAQVYDAWLDSKKHSAFTGDTAVMTRKPGGEFSVFSGYVNGKNLSLDKDKSIVQLWHFAEKGWPEGHYSTCSVSLSAVPGGTRLTLVQRDVPDVAAENLKLGWKKYYWSPMKDYFAG
ncbi:MAG: SRPBCC domain-containing protein [Flavobacteriales bacterium]|nr:SRPBCC domain-containing protein [Flavobacteriales bacterium]